MPTATNAILDRVIGPVTAEEEAEFDREYGGVREELKRCQCHQRRKLRDQERKTVHKLTTFRFC